MTAEEICELICKDESRKSRRECFSFVEGDCSTIRNCKEVLGFHKQETLRRVGKWLRKNVYYEEGTGYYHVAVSGNDIDVLKRGETPEGWEE